MKRKDDSGWGYIDSSGCIENHDSNIPEDSLEPITKNLFSCDVHLTGILSDLSLTLTTKSFTKINITSDYEELSANLVSVNLRAIHF